MKRLAQIAAVVALGGATAHADPLPAWSDWVGAYTGTLRWTGCTAPGNARATITLDATDAVMTVDLAPAGGALPALSLVYDDEHATWSAQQGELRATLSRPRAGALAVVVELDSGCTVRGTLARASTGVAACDRLLGWARIEARCTRVTGDRLEDAVALGKRAWKTADAASCTVRGDRIATELVAAGCAPDPDAAAAVLGTACRALATEAARLAQCPRATPAIAGIVAQLRMLPASHADPAQRALAEAHCEAGRELVARLARDARCPL